MTKKIEWRLGQKRGASGGYMLEKEVERASWGTGLRKKGLLG